jgi:predicted anti-sigma-YlaC factor YlaD
LFPAGGNFPAACGHYCGMECSRAREAISARIDGEDPGVAGDAIEAHLAACGDCRQWQQRAYTVTRRARLGSWLPGTSFPDHDLTPRLLAAVRPALAGRRRRLGQRAGLTAVALAQLAITVPLLVLGHDHDAGTHAAHELGSFDLALAIAYLVGAVRPVLSAGLAWPCGAAATGLVATAVADMIGGQTVGADEAQHLIAVAGAALLFWQARTVARTTEPGLAAGRRRGGADPAAMRRDRPIRLPGYQAAGDLADFPEDTDAARLSPSQVPAAAAGARRPAASGHQAQAGHPEGTAQGGEAVA